MIPSNGLINLFVNKRFLGPLQQDNNPFPFVIQRFFYNLEKPLFLCDGENLMATRLNSPLLKAVENAIKRETAAGFKLKVCIGTDSQVKGKETEFATVIVFLREGHGGFMFIHNEKTSSNLPSRKEC